MAKITGFTLTDFDNERLDILCKMANMTRTGYIRMLLDSVWLAHKYEEIMKTGKVELDGVEYSLDPVQLTEIAEEITSAFKKVDWERLKVKVARKPKKRLKLGYKLAS